MDPEVQPSYASEIPRLYSFQSYVDGTPNHTTGTIICDIMLFNLHTKYCYINLYQCLRYSGVHAIVGSNGCFYTTFWWVWRYCIPIAHVCFCTTYGVSQWFSTSSRYILYSDCCASVDYKNVLVYQCCTLIPIPCETNLNAMMSNSNVLVCAIEATRMQTEKG
jgi:hypothetical protein